MAFQKLTKLFNKQSAEAPRSRQPAFGVRLDRNATEVPVIVRKALAYFEKKGVEVEGLFRISSNAQHLSELMERFDNGEDVDLLQIDEPHLVAGLLKQYFMQLPEPLLTFELYDCFLAATGVAQQRALYSPMKKALEYLPPGHYLVLSALVKLLNFVSKFSAQNKMTSSNLAITFSPSLIRPESDPRFSVMVKDTGRANALLEILISHYEEFFEDALPKAPTSAPTTENTSGSGSGKGASTVETPLTTPEREKVLKSRGFDFVEPTNANVLNSSFILCSFPRVALYSFCRGKYVVCLENRLYSAYLHANPLQCWKSTQELFSIWHQEGDFRISIMSDQGTYWSVSSDTIEITHKEAKTLQPAELFDVETRENDMISFRSVAHQSNLFFTSEGTLCCSNDSTPTPSETSELFKVSIKVAFKANTGKFISALETGIEANRTLALIWEMFIVQPEGSGLCSIGRYSEDQILAYWRVRPNGSLDANGALVSSENEKFYFEETEPFQFTIRTCYGTYIQLDIATNKLVAVSTEKDDACIFTLVPLTVPTEELARALQSAQAGPNAVVYTAPATPATPVPPTNASGFRSRASIAPPATKARSVKQSKPANKPTAPGPSTSSPSTTVAPGAQRSMSNTTGMKASPPQGFTKAKPRNAPASTSTSALPSTSPGSSPSTPAPSPVKFKAAKVPSSGATLRAPAATNPSGSHPAPTTTSSPAGTPTGTAPPVASGLAVKGPSPTGPTGPTGRPAAATISAGTVKAAARGGSPSGAPVARRETGPSMTLGRWEMKGPNRAWSKTSDSAASSPSSPGSSSPTSSSSSIPKASPAKKQNHTISASTFRTWTGASAGGSGIGPKPKAPSATSPL